MARSVGSNEDLNVVGFFSKFTSKSPFILWILTLKVKAKILGLLLLRPWFWVQSGALSLVFAIPYCLLGLILLQYPLFWPPFSLSQWESFWLPLCKANSPSRSMYWFRSSLLPEAHPPTDSTMWLLSAHCFLWEILRLLSCIPFAGFLSLSFWGLDWLAWVAAFWSAQKVWFGQTYCHPLLCFSLFTRQKLGFRATSFFGFVFWPAFCILSFQATSLLPFKVFHYYAFWRITNNSSFWPLLVMAMVLVWALWLLTGIIFPAPHLLPLGGQL